VLSYIHKNKTAAFIRAVILAGAYLGGADEGVIDDLENYANSFGLAFQITDDIQDVIGSEEERGKAVGGDAELDKLTYPSVYGIEESRRLAQDNLETARRSVQKYGEKAEVFLAFIKYLEDHLG
ncbi:MAG: polyprenyl synthetase family protein, partial [Firmicutes bacterium]|nr:polyprenyl synthetase family protein [Bacillota bacterium]